MIDSRTETDRSRQLESVQQSEARLRAIAEQMPCVLWTVDMDLRFTSSYGAGLKNLGLKPGQAVGLLLEDYFQGQAQQEEQLENHRLACHGEAVSYETNAFGRRFQTYLEPLRDNEGRITGALGVAFDVTERMRAQEALQQSESQLRLITSQVPGAIWTTDLSLRFTSFYAAERKESLKPRDATGISLEEFFASDEEKQLSVSAHRRACAGETVVYSSTVYGRYYFNYLEPLRSAAGEIIGVLGIALDVTDRKQAEATLRASEENYRRLLEQAPDGIFLTDSDGRFLLANSKMREMLGYTEEEILRLNVADTYVPEDRGVIRERLNQLRSGRRLQLERRMLRKDGTWFLVESSSAARVDGTLQGIVRDITERRQAEEALQASEEKYHRFFEENLAGYYLMNAAGQLLDCNPAFARMFGFASREEASGRAMASLCPKPEALSEFIALVTARKRLEQYARELRGKDGGAIQVLENAIGVFDPQGRLVEIRGYLVDDTERWKAEQQFRQVQKMDAMGRLAAGVAHDFNNLLTVINGYGDLVLKKLPASDPLLASVWEIRKAGEKAAGLVRQLLAFSRQQPTELRSLDLNAVITNSVRMLERLIGEDIRLQVRLAASLPPAQADSGQIDQILVNLAVNAKDAMPSGGTLTIETAAVEVGAGLAAAHPELTPGPYVLLTVSDSGTGMDPHTLQRLFEPFYTTKPPGKGVGLGLSTVYGIVKQNGGWIDVESRPGYGAMFRIYWPQAGDGAFEEKTPVTPPLSPGVETILLVEDQEQVRLLAEAVLASCGYRVLTSPDGPSALLVAERHHDAIDMLVSDVVMPGMSGPELAEQLKTVHPAIRVLYMSGYSGETIVQNGILEPDVAYLPKPFSAAELSAKVRAVLGPSPRRRS